MSLVSAGGYSFGLLPCRSRRRAKAIAKAALVEARPRAVPALRKSSGSGSVQKVLVGDRADDLQAEARAMARAVNASVYSPELLARDYGSRPVQVVWASIIPFHLFVKKKIFFLFLINWLIIILIQLLRRTLQILVALGSFSLKLLIDQRNGVLDQNKRKRAAELRRIFTRLGPTFVKLGQGLSTRPDICPPEYLEELSELQVLLIIYITNLLWTYLYW